MEQEQTEARYVILTQAILGSKELTISDKLVLARISGFVRFFESNETTAKFLGIGERTVRTSKAHLLELGYIVEIANTGHGKIYAADLLRVAKSANQTGKNCRSDRQNLPPENKYRINIEHTKRADSDAQSVENSEKTERGRKDINELVDLWEAETNVAIKGDQNQRRQIYNLTRKYGAEGTRGLIQRVGKMKRACDRYAPSIMKPSDLVGKYSKLDRMLAWEERQRFTPKQPTPPRITPTKFEEHEISDEERARISAQIKAAREKLGFSRNSQS